MTVGARPTQFGRIYAPDEAWLAKRPPEPILEPDLPIIDTHHHLWERPDHRYLLHEFLDDVQTGHNVVATVFMECGAPLGYGPYAGKQEEVFRTWKAGVSDLATCDNVVMKLGGMMMRRASFDYRTAPAPPTSEELAALWRPFIETCIELFGPSRCMFESNFPVDKMGIGWAALWNTFKRIVAGASADEKLAMFCGTARRVYRIS